MGPNIAQGCGVAYVSSGFEELWYALKEEHVVVVLGGAINSRVVAVEADDL